MVAVSWSRCGRWETLAKAQRPSRPNASLRGLPAKESESLQGRVRDAHGVIVAV